MSKLPDSTSIAEIGFHEATLPPEPRSDGLPALLGGKPAFTSRMPFVRPSLPPWESLSQPIRDIITTGMLTKGHYLDAFEERVARHLGVKHAVAVSSCTAGLMLVYRCLGLEGEVLVPSFTFMATVHPLMWQGATPVFIDIDRQTWDIDLEQIEAHITPRTTAIVAVHIFGNPAPIEELEAIARRHGLVLIFDAAHGFGALHRGMPLGRYGNAEVFSTSPTKLLVTGEGGIVATNDRDLADQIRLGREYGNPGSYDSLLPGMNARMQEFSAILGLQSLEMLEDNTRRRNGLATFYQSYLAGIPGITFQTIRPSDRSSYKDFTIRIEATKFGLDRNTLSMALTQEGISTRAYYVPPVHQHTTYQELVRLQRLHVPVTETLAQDVLSLPIYSSMPASSVIEVCQAIRRIHQYAAQIQAVLSEDKTNEEKRGTPPPH
jgi:dTDP-4-amino-4,6-dideoxygalactose transaminase